MMEENKQKLVLVSKKDLIIEWFSGHGAGGQYRNRHQNCCRITHPESRATAVATQQRSATQNQKEAFINLCKTANFKMWLARKLMEISTGKTLDQRVEEQMAEKYLRVECLENGQWTPFEEKAD